jgi:hypothetical protein
MEIDTGGMDAAELAWAARFAARLAEHWPEDHQPTRRLLSTLAYALTACQVDLESRIAAIEVGQADTITTRMRLGMVDPSEPVRLGWIDDVPPDD